MYNDISIFIIFLKNKDKCTSVVINMTSKSNMSEDLF